MLPRLYRDLAHLWPLLSPPSDYSAEAEAVRGLLRRELGIGRLRVLELGAGGGHTLHHLRDEFECVAVDLSPEMLGLCHVLNPGVQTHVGDMRSVRLGRVFDAVLIHDAIDYMTSRSDVASTLATAAAHLRAGGVVLVAPTYTLETFQDGEASLDQALGENVLLTCTCYVHRLNAAGSTFELLMVLLLQPSGMPVEVVLDRHRCGLFSDAAWCTSIRAAGFELRKGAFEAEVPWEPYVGVTP